jgi:hypothetical protein
MIARVDIEFKNGFWQNKCYVKPLTMLAEKNSFNLPN